MRGAVNMRRICYCLRKIIVADALLWCGDGIGDLIRSGAVSLLRAVCGCFAWNGGGKLGRA